MGFAEGIMTAIGMIVVFYLTSDMTTVLFTGILCVAFMMKGDKD